MPCFLLIGGEDFDAISFLNETKLENAIVKLKGEVINPRKGLSKISTVGVNITEIGFDDLSGQIKDTIAYLEKHQEQFSIIKKTKGISFASLNFGLTLDIKLFNEKQNKSFFWPVELLKLVGDLGITIELRLYAPPSDTVVVG